MELALEVFSSQPKAVERVKARLDESLAGGARFDHLVDAGAELFDLEPERVRALFASLDTPEAWAEGPAPKVHLMPVAPGKRAENSFAALVRLDPGATFPEHEHFGEERVLVLEGGYRSSGEKEEFWRGELDT